MFEPLPPMWTIVHSSPHGPRLQFGGYDFAIADIHSIEACEIEERDNSGLAAAGILFMCTAIMVLIGVVDAGWRLRFLAAVAILAILAVMSVMEAFAIKPVSTTRLTISTPEGDVVFTTPDADDAKALMHRVRIVQRDPNS